MHESITTLTLPSGRGSKKTARNTRHVSEPRAEASVSKPIALESGADIANL
jgi:hypothetical protein